MLRQPGEGGRGDSYHPLRLIPPHDTKSQGQMSCGGGAVSQSTCYYNYGKFGEEAWFAINNTKSSSVESPSSYQIYMIWLVRYSYLSEIYLKYSAYNYIFECVFFSIVSLDVPGSLYAGWLWIES